MASKTDENVSRGVKRKHQSISIHDKVELLNKLERGVSVRRLYIKMQREKILKFYVDSDLKR